MKKIILSSAVIFGAFTSLSAVAQVPATAESGRLTDRFTREKIESRVTDRILVQDDVQRADIAGAEQIKMKLKDIKLQGNKVFAESELTSLYADKLGTQVTLADIYAIRDSITKKYREAGYITSRAILPEQDFDKNGAVVTIRIIEGYVNNVSVQGATQGNQDLINNYVGKIKREGALNSAVLERYLLLINDLAGSEAKAVLRPSASGVGGTDVVIEVTHDKAEGMVNFDNSGTKFIGPYLMSAKGSLNSALGLSEKITATVISDLDVNELKFGEVSYKQPIGYEGTQLKLGYGITDSNPGATINNLGINGDTRIISAELTHPFLRSRKENFTARLGVAAKDTLTTAYAGELYNDEVRTLTLGGTYDRADSLGGVNLLDLSITQGVDVFGATDSNSIKSRTNADATFTRYNFEASRSQRLVDTLYLYVASAGQYSNEGLLASEEFGFGGREFGRGYDFSEITGDSGLAAKIELQYGLNNTKFSYLTDIQPYVFYDIGRIWQKEAFVSGEDMSVSAASAGVGVRFNITESVASYTELAKPLTKDISSEGDRDVRFSFGISYIF